MGVRVDDLVNDVALDVARVLMDNEGPFKRCAHDGHKTRTSEKAAPPHVVPEAGIFD